MQERLFAPFEIALQAFHDAGGAHVTAIWVPSAILVEYLRTLPNGRSGGYYMETPVLLAGERDFVSISGTTITGQDVEVPATAP